jgi:hypothetical protein
MARRESSKAKKGKARSKGKRDIKENLNNCVTDYGILKRRIIRNFGVKFWRRLSELG